jgi:hypothetical protein
MYSDCADSSRDRSRRLGLSLETVALAFAVGCAVAALAVYLMPNEALDWAIAHLG